MIRSGPRSTRKPPTEASRVDGVKGRRVRTLPLAVLVVRPLPLELRLEARDLVLELAEHGVLRIFINFGLIFYIFGAVRVAQRRHGLVVVVARLCGTDAVAKLSPFTHEMRGLSGDRDDAIDAKWHRDDAIAATTLC